MQSNYKLNKPNTMLKSTERYLDNSTMEDLLNRYQKPKSPRFNSFRGEIYPEHLANFKLSRFEYRENDYEIKNRINSNDNSCMNTYQQPQPQQQQQQQQQYETNTNKPRGTSSRKPKPRNKMRYMTQPITLIEIKETEEDL